MTGQTGTWRRVARYFARYRGLTALAGTLMLVTVTLSAIAPLLLQRVINDALPRHQAGQLALLCGAMIGAGVASGAVAIGQGMLTNRMGQRVVHDLRVELYGHLQAMPLPFFAGDANTEIQARLVSDIGGINEILTLTAQGALMSLAGLITACAVMLILNWPLALASIVLALLLNLLNQRFTTRRNLLAVRRQDLTAGLMRLVAEDLSLPGVILGRTLGRTQFQRGRFTGVSAEISEVTYRQRLAGRTAMAIISMTLACLPPLIYLLAGTVVPGISLGTAVVLATMQVRLSGPIQNLLSLSGTLQSSRAMFDRVFAYLDLVPAADQVAADQETAGLAAAWPGAPPCLTVRGLSYRYPSAGRDAVDQVAAEFPPHSFTVVAGHSGSGKSTLALLLAGLLAPTAGQAVLGGTGVADPAALRAGVTLVRQDMVLFNASVRENLLFARPQASDTDLAEALETASLAQLVRQLPLGLDTQVGERGYQLSGGERQRLALARALLSGSPVLVVDEATSALDGGTASDVCKRLHRLCERRTVIMIAHRLPRLAGQDRVVLMAAGRVTEQGSHAELLARRGAYHQMARAQSVIPNDPLWPAPSPL